MVDFTVALFSLLTMLLLMFVGFFLRRKNLVGEAFSGNASTLTLYVAMPCMIINAFLTDYDPELLSMVLQVFVLSLITHIALILITFCLFKKSPQREKSVLRYMVLFSNCGFMGFPVLISVFPEQSATAVLLGACYQVWFNLATWTIGVRFFHAGSKLQWKRLAFNPGTIGVVIGLICLFSGAHRFLPAFITDPIRMLGNLVTPLSMMIVGISVSSIRLKDLFTSKSLFSACAWRQIITPALFIGVVILLRTLGVAMPAPLVIAVPYVLLCMPAATATVMMAKQNGGDAEFAAKGVTLSTVTSVLTIPLMSLLLQL